MSTINIPTKTFVRFWLVIFALALALIFIDKAKTGLIIVGAAIFLSIAIKPFGDRLGALSRKILRSNRLGAHLDDKVGAKWSVIAYLIVLIIFVAIVAITGPVVVDQTSKFIGKLPDTFQHTIGGWDGINDFGASLGITDLQSQITAAVQNFSTSITANLGSILMNSLGTISSIFTAVAFTLVLTLFFMIQGPTLMSDFWKTLAGKRQGDAGIATARRIISRMAHVISTYVSRQVFVAVIDGVIVGAITAVLALIFHFDNLSIPLGLIAMIFYLIPMFGQVIACVLITILLLVSSPVAAVIFAVFYLIYAQVENNFIAPKIQGDSLGLPPVIILVAIIIGTYMFGLLGAIISVPIAGCIKVLIEEYPNIRDLQEKSA